MKTDLDFFKLTKWDMTNWNKEQKHTWNEAVIAAGGKIHSLVSSLSYSRCAVSNLGGAIHHNGDRCFRFFVQCKDKTWEDFLGYLVAKEFPLNFLGYQDEAPKFEPKIEDHDCMFHYSSVQECCLKCHPEKDPRQRYDMYAVAATPKPEEGIPTEVRGSEDLWGILDTQKREEELILKVRACREGEEKLIAPLQRDIYEKIFDQLYGAVWHDEHDKDMSGMAIARTRDIEARENRQRLKRLKLAEAYGGGNSKDDITPYHYEVWKNESDREHLRRMYGEWKDEEI